MKTLRDALQVNEIGAEAIWEAVTRVHTQFAAATCATVRLALLKIGALMRVSARRIKFPVALRSSLPVGIRA